MEPDYRVWLEVLVSGVLVGTTMVVHGFGMYWVARAAKYLHFRLDDGGHVSDPESRLRVA